MLLSDDELNAMQVEIDDWKARALKAEQAGKYICPVRTVADLVNNLKLMDQTLPIYGAQYIEHLGKSRCIATPPTVSRERIKDSRWIGEGDTLNAAVIWTRAEQPPQPAAQEPASAVPVVEQFLQDGDQHLLHSFIETTEDDEGYMLTKPEIKRLAELGVVQSHGFGKYSVTMFGHWVHERYWHQNPSLPLKTNTDRTADAAIAAGQQYLKENGK